MAAVASKEITLKPVSSSEQLADLLTKPLEKQKFTRLRDRILTPLPAT